MARKSIYAIAHANKSVREMMEECYLDLENDDDVPSFVSTNVINLNLLLSG